MQETTATTKNILSTSHHLVLLYITHQSTDKHKCVYKAPEVDLTALSNTAAGMLETGLRSYWQTAPWEKRSPSSHRQSLTVNRRQTATSRSRQKGRCYWRKGLHRNVCFGQDDEETITTLHLSQFQCFFQSGWKWELFIHPPVTSRHNTS